MAINKVPVINIVDKDDDFYELDERDYTGDIRIDSLLGETKWGGAIGNGAVISYSFPISSGEQNPWVWVGYGREPYSEDFGVLDEKGQEYFVQAREAWSEVANIQFWEVPDTHDVPDDSDFTPGVIRVAYATYNFGNRYDLSVMSVATTDDLVDEGQSLVVVALVDADLHIRIFDVNGKKVVDKAEGELVAGEALEKLRLRLDPFPDDSSLSPEDKLEIIRYANVSSGGALGEAAGWASYPGSGLRGGDVWLNGELYADSSLAPGNEVFETLLHEMGHALGLKHPRNYNPSDTSDLELPVEDDHAINSVMSCAAGYDGDWILPHVTPMLYDIVAVHGDTSDRRNLVSGEYLE